MPITRSELKKISRRGRVSVKFKRLEQAYDFMQNLETGLGDNMEPERWTVVISHAGIELIDCFAGDETPPVMA
jgi:hypothetical protein